MMKHLLKTVTAGFSLLALVLGTGCSQHSPSGNQSQPRTVTVAQQGNADVTGSDNVAIQRAADMLGPGDTLEIGPGEYLLHNSVIIPVSGVTVRGVPGETILKKARAVLSMIVEGGDWGESVFVVAEPDKFKTGMGVSLLDDTNSQGYGVVTGTVTDVRSDTVFLSERSVNDLNYVNGNARLESTFPLLAGYELENVVIEGITADGNKDQNPFRLDGCRGGAIYLFDCRNITIRNCVARNYNGDGISWQITDKISVLECESYGNTGLGLHPGTGSSNSVITDCHAHHNGIVGLFLCYRVQHGKFTGNLLENNGRYGISIGHKDSDNLFENNTVRNNGFSGVYFRRNPLRVGGHRNVFRNNEILNNGDKARGYGVFAEAENQDEIFENNVIAETRAGGEATQRYGVYIAKGNSSVKAGNNEMKGHSEADFHDENATSMK
ncbi:right-handed parallel beta-helix repeat-containing protein [Gemmatimonadota bacterium]